MLIYQIINILILKSNYLQGSSSRRSNNQAGDKGRQGAFKNFCICLWSVFVFEETWWFKNSWEIFRQKSKTFENFYSTFGNQGTGHFVAISGQNQHLDKDNHQSFVTDSYIRLLVSMFTLLTQSQAARTSLKLGLPTGLNTIVIRYR